MKTFGTSHIVHDFFYTITIHANIVHFPLKTFIQCDVAFLPIQRVTIISIHFELNYYYIFFKRYMAK